MAESSMKGPLFSSYDLHPDLNLALKAAADQAREWEQDCLGVEHLLLGILETEAQDGPVLSSLALPGFTGDTIGKILIPVSRVPANRPVPDVIPFTPRCQLVLDLAADLAQREKRRLVDAGHVLRAIMAECESLAAWALAEACADHLTRAESTWPAGLRTFVEWALVAHGAAWEFPGDAELAILAALRICGRMQPEQPDPQFASQSFVVHHWFAAAMVTVMRSGRKVRVLVCPGARIEEPWRPRHHRLAAKISRCLAAIPGAVRITRHSFLSAWPSVCAGRLERTRFAGMSPAGKLRAWQASDEAASLKLFQSLELSGQIPPGHMDGYLASLRSEDAVTLVLEHEGALAGTATATIPDAEITDHALAVRALNLVFGLVLPDCQRRGIGLTLMAARLWMAVRLQRNFVFLEATRHSRPWLAKAGFRFVPSQRQDGNFFSGSLLLENEDEAFLGSWLGVENTLTLTELTVRINDAALPARSR